MPSREDMLKEVIAAVEVGMEESWSTITGIELGVEGFTVNFYDGSQLILDVRGLRHD